MNGKEFRIWFSDGTYEPQMVLVWAISEEQAIILAQAERIKAACDYTLHSCIEK